ncbi:WD40 repeat-like protein [Violaceomyces palustris]|uniref:WD40 repeat-like protein n=1 Tax=Violaceomyces palustris TaxID=1673888 RepID=A0ACD0NVJ9_9BASI|nr:WD40 repeat-like protein [Violaceomyces palustris]
MTSDVPNQNAVEASSMGGDPSSSYLATTKRVSYVLPPCPQPPRYFALPPLGVERQGRTGPIVLPKVLSPPHAHRVPSSASTPTETPSSYAPTPPPGHPQHTLAVSSLAIDPSTCISSHGHNDSKPQGILYTGGRDGLVGAWELGLNMRRREKKIYQGRDWLSQPTDMQSSETQNKYVDEKEGTYSLLDRHEARSNGWEVDPHLLDQTPRTSFRQCVQSHTDWINDIVLCNQNQTLISASSDRTVKVWNPHDSESSLRPDVLGTHKDYVKCLAHASEAGYVASGSFDRTVKLWDIREIRKVPLLEFGEKSVKSSVYALSVNASGSVVAGGSPAQHVKVWDPRSGQQSAELIGHTDNIRSVLVSEDGRHVLSGSADSTIRLWSLGEQRCLHTFTHHADSVWSLFSTHPNLDIFYSGDRQGYVCKVDWERCSEVSEGECVVLCRERGEARGFDQNKPDDPHGLNRDDASAGVQKIVSLDDAFFWTATGSSSVNRWKDIPTRRNREALYPMTGPGTQPNPSGHRLNHGRGITHMPSVSFIEPDTSPNQEAEGHSLPRADVAAADQLPSAVLELDLPPSGTSPAAAMYGIPFDSLVSLAPVNDPYGDQIGLGSVSIRDPRGFEDEESGFQGPPVSVAGEERAAGEISPGLDHIAATSSPSQMAVNSPLAQLQASELQRPSSMRSASIRFAPTDLMIEGRDRRDSIDISDDASTDDTDSAYEARLAYEDRELVKEATPLRLRPCEVIEGSHGLIRSLILNDRRHVLAISSIGVVTLWDIVKGICLGAFDREELTQAAEESGLWSEDIHGRVRKWTPEANPGETLEMVKERIEGQGVTPLWCSTDTKSGALAVHLEEPRCFEAEFYVDEFPDCLDPSPQKEDQRGQVCTWILRNLFDGFIRAEERIRAQSSTAAPMVEAKPFNELTTIEAKQPSLVGTLDLGNRLGIQTPGMTIGLATPAKTPALTPAGCSPLTAAVQRNYPSFSMLATSSNGAGPGDYFSIKGASNGPITEAARPPTQKSEFSVVDLGREAPSPTVSSINSIEAALKDGGFMSRIKSGLGNVKNPRNERPELSGVTSVIDGHSHALVKETQEGQAPSKDLHPHLIGLEQIFSKAVSPLSMGEIPRLLFAPDTAIIISESSADAGSWEVVYRGLVSSTETDAGVLEMTSPIWLLEFLLMNQVVVRDQPKISFTLQPWVSPSAKPDGFGGFGGGHGPMPDLPNSASSRLSATRMLRIKKACAYVCEKLELASSRSRNNSIAGSRRSSAEVGQRRVGGLTSPSSNLSMTSLAANMATSKSSNEPTPTAHTTQTAESDHFPDSLNDEVEVHPAQPHDIIEILCNDLVLPVNLTLAQCHRFYWRAGGDIKLEYRMKKDRMFSI